MPSTVRVGVRDKREAAILPLYLIRIRSMASATWMRCDACGYVCFAPRVGAYSRRLARAHETGHPAKAGLSRGHVRSAESRALCTHVSWRFWTSRPRVSSQRAGRSGCSTHIPWTRQHMPPSWTVQTEHSPACSRSIRLPYIASAAIHRMDGCMERHLRKGRETGECHALADNTKSFFRQSGQQSFTDSRFRVLLFLSSTL